MLSLQVTTNKLFHLCGVWFYSPIWPIKIHRQPYVKGSIASGNLSTHGKTRQWKTTFLVTKRCWSATMSTCFHRKMFSSLLLTTARSPCLCWQKWRASSIDFVILLIKYCFPLHTNQPSAVVLKSAEVWRQGKITLDLIFNDCTINQWNATLNPVIQVCFL